jgi:hypothetical protein
MATLFRNKAVKDVGLVPIEVIDNNAATQSTVIGAALTNLTEEPVYASILVQDDTSVTAHYLKDTMIPPNSTLKAINGGEKLIIAPSCKLLVQSDSDDSLDAVFSYVDIV